MSDDPKPARPIPRIGAGSPATIRLEQFGQYIADAFGHTPYHVGSSTRGKQWRDVDVRLILPGDHFDALFPGYERAHELDAFWSLLCNAISELGKQMTHLPVDFQIQRQTQANEQFGGQIRQPLFRIRLPEWQPPTAKEQPE
jgi:hypothetical protein